MDKFDIETLWKADRLASIPEKGVYASARDHQGKSLNLVSRIRRTAQGEHRIFLLLSAIAIPVLLILGHTYWAAGLGIFAGLMIWKYRVEISMLDHIQLQDNTLAYLISVRDLLHQFMRIYRIAILILSPLVVAGGILFGVSLQGREVGPLLQTGKLWIVLLISVLFTLGALRGWLYLWTQSLYGKKLRELNQLIQEFSEQ